jgi:SAM-dependent methyltransferase
MLAQLGSKAESRGLDIELVQGNAADPPRGGFDAVVERHVVWTLPDPKTALEAWREAAPEGRLVLIESIWGKGAGPEENLRAFARELLRKFRNEPDDHHARYGEQLVAELPFGTGASPEMLLGLVESTSWPSARIERLRDVEWATRQALASPLDRLVGVAPRFAVTAG